MSDSLLNIVAGTMPQDCYPASADAYQKQILALARAVFPGTTAGVAIGSTAPTDHTMVWARTDASNNFIRFYTWGGTGQWVSQHPIPSSPNQTRLLWVGVESDLVTYDEGTTDPITPTTGAFWQADHAFDGRFPIGSTTAAVNPLPSGTVIPAGGTGGEETHALLTTEMPPHIHAISVLKSKAESGSGQLCLQDPSQGDVSGTVPSTPFNTDSTGGSTPGSPTPPLVVPHNNMPPYVGVFMIKRTIRTYYTS